MRLCIAVTLVFLLVSSVSQASPEEFREFPEFRYISGLPGGGFGVTPDGRVGFDGALQMNVPVAYTPCGGNYVLGYWSGSTDPWDVTLDTEGPKVNGTGLLAAGFGKSDHGVYVAFMPTSKESEAVWNFQIQLRRDDWDKPAFAVGVQDSADQRDRVRGGRGGGGRSYYGVATGRLGTEEKFVFLTLGWGGGRFNSRPFGGISWPFHDKFTAFVEYDGFNANVGLAHSWRPRLHQDRLNMITLFGLVDLDRPLIGSCITYSH
jgi:hypothetical protein